MAGIGLFFGSTEGNTENVAEQIQKELGSEKVKIHNVRYASADDVQKYDTLIFGCPTWEIGELQDDWETFIDILDDVNFSGKKVTYFGLGDAENYPNTFVDAIGIIHERLQDKGADFFGQWSPEEYSFAESKALLNGEFLGLVIDEENEPEKTPNRVSNWCKENFN